MKARSSFVIALLLVISSAGAYFIGHLAAAVPAPPAHVIRVVSEATLVRQLRERYGPGKNSSNLEEWIVRDFFRDERGGVFVDVGANHHQVRSNTYYLESRLGWSGVAVEPQARFAEGYKEFRPRTTFVPLFVSDVSDKDAVLYVPRDNSYGRIASADRAFVESFGAPSDPTEVRTTTLDVVLKQLRISKVDYLTMDIELAEPQALAGFSITRFRPRLVCIEAHEGVQQQILEYFARHEYVLIGKYLEIDHENYWFTPTGTVKDEPAPHGSH